MLVRVGVISIKIVYIDDVLFSYRLVDEAATANDPVAWSTSSIEI